MKKLPRVFVLRFIFLGSQKTYILLKNQNANLEKKSKSKFKNIKCQS